MMARSSRPDTGLATAAFPVRAVGDVVRGAVLCEPAPGDLVGMWAVGVVDVVRRLPEVLALVRVAAVLRVVPPAARGVLPTAADARGPAIRSAFTRAGAVRLVDIRVVDVGMLAVRLVVAVALDRVVFFVGVLVAAVLVGDFADVFAVVRGFRAEDARGDFTRVDAALAARTGVVADFVVAFLGADFFGATGREGVVPPRVMRAVPPRGLVPAARRPPVRTTVPRRREPLVSLSLLMLEPFSLKGR